MAKPAAPIIEAPRAALAAIIRDTLTARPIGIAGLDALGLGLARRLVAHGLRVLCWDRDPARRAASAALGGLAEPAASLTDLGHDCDVVLSTLPPPDLATAAFGEVVATDDYRPGFALAMAPGSLVVDMGIALPADAQRLAALLGRGGIGLVDAPVLGTPTDAEAGEALVSAGGFGAFVERLEPLLALFGRVQRAGIHGRGHALAALTVYARHAEAEAAREALRVGLACGLTAELMPDVAAAAVAGPADDDPRLAIARRLASELAADRAETATPSRAASSRTAAVGR